MEITEVNFIFSPKSIPSAQLEKKKENYRKSKIKEAQWL